MNEERLINSMEPGGSMPHTTGMRGKGINMEWVHREEWRRKMKKTKTSVTERCANIKILYINKM